MQSAKLATEWQMQRQIKQRKINDSVQIKIIWNRIGQSWIINEQQSIIVNQEKIVSL